jgi:hypothetical protein
MANHVYFNITSEKPMDNCFKTIKVERDWGVGKIEMEEFSPLFEQPFMQKAMKGVEIDEDGWPTASYDWHVNNIGAKWCNLEDYDEDFLTGYSAWSPPVEMVSNLAIFLKTNLTMTYEDENRCFIGIAWVDENGEEDVEELEDGDLQWELAQAMGLDELPDDFDWDDEQKDLDGQSGQEWTDDFVYEWFSSNR